MSLRNSLNKNIYKYLGYHNLTPDTHINSLIDIELDEVIKRSNFKFRYLEMTEIIDELNKEPYISFLKGCEKYYITVYTLGSEIDSYSRYITKLDMQKGVIFDAVASSYIEYLADSEDSKLQGIKTYRFCPGYQGTSLEDIRPLYKLLKADKLGIALLDSNLMIPFKTMIGIIGVGKEMEKSCKGCVKASSCDYLKENMRCYN